MFKEEKYDSGMISNLTDILSSTTNERDVVFQTSHAQKERIEIGLQQVREGRTISHEEANRLTREWLAARM